MRRVASLPIASGYAAPSVEFQALLEKEVGGGPSGTPCDLPAGGWSVLLRGGSGTPARSPWQKDAALLPDRWTVRVLAVPGVLGLTAPARLPNRCVRRVGSVPGPCRTRAGSPVTDRLPATFYTRGPRTDQTQVVADVPGQDRTGGRDQGPDLSHGHAGGAASGGGCDQAVRAIWGNTALNFSLHTRPVAPCTGWRVHAHPSAPSPATPVPAPARHLGSRRIELLCDDGRPWTRSTRGNGSTSTRPALPRRGPGTAWSTWPGVVGGWRTCHAPVNRVRLAAFLTGALDPDEASDLLDQSTQAGRAPGQARAGHRGQRARRLHPGGDGHVPAQATAPHRAHDWRVGVPRGGVVDLGDRPARGHDAPAPGLRDLPGRGASFGTLQPSDTWARSP